MNGIKWPRKMWRSRKILKLLAAAVILAVSVKTAGAAQAVSASYDEPQNDQTGEGAIPQDQPVGDDGAEPDASQEPEDGRPQDTTTIIVDNRNLYEGMDRPYAEGYSPRIENNQALVIVPMLLQGEEGAALGDNTLRVSLDLGDSGSSPFVYRNYNKNVTLGSHTVNNGTGTVESYVADFWLELNTERFNGSYPVTLSVEGKDDGGNPISQNFVVYVTITDGKDPNAQPQEPELEPEPEEPPTFAPKLLVQSYRYSREEFLAGDTVTAEITLQNTSKTQQIKNLTVTVSAQPEFLTLQSATDSVYIDSVKPGETCVISFDYQVNAATPQGQYDLTLAMDYADAKGSTYTGNGKARLSVKQPIELQFDPIVLPAQLEVGDVLQLQVQAMNLGRCKAYHVRAELVADGLTPQGTIFIGDIEAGAMALGTTQISVGGLTEGSSRYGDSNGTVTFYYEDESGAEQSQEMEFFTTIASPFSERPTEEVEDEPGQWWILMAVVLVLLLCCGGFLCVRWIQERKRRAEEP